MDKTRWQKLQDFQDDNKDLLIMIASPKDDSMSVSFGGMNGFVRFPSKDLADGVIFNALRESKFESTIDAFMTGLMESTGISDKKDGGEVLKVLGGGMKKFGEKNKLLINNKKNGKATKN